MNTLDPRDYAVNLAVAYPDTPLFDFAIDNQILRKDQIHDYVLNAGFGDYPLNLSEFKTGKLLVRAVSIMQIRLMFHFLRKERLYKELLKLLLKRIRIEIGFVLNLFIPNLINIIRKKKEVEILNAFNRKRQTEYFDKEAA